MNRFLRVLLVLSVTLSLFAFAGPSAPVNAGVEQTYLVLYKTQAISSASLSLITQAGGQLVNSYPQIGVAIARSSSDTFKASLLKADKNIDGVSATAAFGTQLQEEVVAVSEEEVASAAAAASTVAGAWGDPLSVTQWDMRLIKVPEAQAVTTGKSSVVVGDIDTGLDYTHPDLAPNVDFTNSVSCVGGVPNQDPAAWMDDNGHGTHTAGTIAAAQNGIGIVGVAPNVKIAGIKAGNADGYFFPEAVICAFMWAGSHHLDVTNNSYFADPWLFNCRNDAEQRAIWKAEQRAIRYAMQQGVTVVAAMGNENIDLSKSNIDTTSPDTNPNPPPREVTNACLVIPVEISGVIGVTAEGAFSQKSYYSSYGVSVTQVVAPGGDRRYQNPGDGSGGYVVSTWPTKFAPSGYVRAQGTSMASPHVAGLAALSVSQYGKLSPGKVQSLIDSTADYLPCPVENPFNPGGAGAWLANCYGDTTYNSFYGHGQVNAYSLVTK